MARRRIGKYEIRESLGKGGMATVFLAWDLDLERKVAVKVLHPLLGDRPEGMGRFHREARAAARLRHPNIIEVFDFSTGSEDEPPFLVYEYVEGPNLADFMRRHPPPLPETAALLGRCLAQALGAAHERGIVHRDIKPENVLVDRSGRLVITDFGIARLAGDATVTATGAVLGSPAYMSPEQARGERTDHRSDIFSLGVLLYHVVTGKMAFSGGTPVAVLSSVLQGEFEPPAKARRDIGPDLERVLNRAMAMAPEERYQSALAMAADLEEVARLGGLEDLDAELAEYLTQPERHEARIEPKVIEASLSRARQNLAHRPALAMALLDRVLAFDPDNSDADLLLKRLRGARTRRLVLVVLAGLLAGAAAVVGATDLLGLRSQSRRQGGPAAAPLDGGAADAAHADGLAAADSGPAEGLLSRDGGGRPDAVGPVSRPGPRVRHRETARRPARARPRGAPMDAGVLAPARTVPDAALLSRVEGPARPARVVPGRLRVLVKPWCTVYLDGRKMGRSPMGSPLVVPPGRHRVVCRQRAGQPGFSKAVTVKSGATVTVQGSLLRPCRVWVPSGSGTWLIDGTPHKPSSYRLPAGRHRVQVVSPKAGSRTRWVFFAPGGTCRLRADPSPRCAR